MPKSECRMSNVECRNNQSNEKEILQRAFAIRASLFLRPSSFVLRHFPGGTWPNRFRFRPKTQHYRKRSMGFYLDRRPTSLAGWIPRRVCARNGERKEG